MTRFARVALVLCFLAASSAIASQRTFVSAATGVDNSTCSRQQPCRNFAAALLVTDPNGELIVLDSGGYGAVQITQSVSLIAPPGVYAGISGFTGAAVEVNALGASVVLRGLTINGQGGSEGIRATQVDVVHIENVVVNGFTLNDVTISAALAATIKDSIVRNAVNGCGIYVADGANAYVKVDNVRMDNLLYGFAADSGSSVTLRNCEASRIGYYAYLFRSLGSNGALRASVENSSASNASLSGPYSAFYADNGAQVTIHNSSAVQSYRGFWVAESTSGTAMTCDRCVAADSVIQGFLAGGAGASGTATLTVSNSTSSHNQLGIEARANGIVRATSNTVVNNVEGLVVNGTFESFGNNSVRGNGTDHIGSPTLVPTM